MASVGFNPQQFGNQIPQAQFFSAPPQFFAPQQVVAAPPQSFAAPVGFGGFDPFQSQMATVHQSMFSGWSGFTGSAPVSAFGNSHPLLQGGYSPPPTGGGGFNGSIGLPYPNASQHSDPFFSQVNSLYNQVGQLASGNFQSTGGGGGGNGTLSQFAVGGPTNDPFYAKLDSLYSQVGALAGGNGQNTQGYSDPFTPKIIEMQKQWQELMLAPPPPIPEVDPEAQRAEFAPLAAMIGEAVAAALAAQGGGGNTGSAGTSGTTGTSGTSGNTGSAGTSGNTGTAGTTQNTSGS